MRTLAMLRGCIRGQCESQLGAVVHVGQAQYLGHVQFYRVFGDAQIAGDLIVGLAFAHQLGNVQLTGRQLFENRRDLLPGALA